MPRGLAQEMINSHYDEVMGKLERYEEQKQKRLKMREKEKKERLVQKASERETIRARSRGNSDISELPYILEASSRKWKNPKE